MSEAQGGPGVPREQEAWPWPKELVECMECGEYEYDTAAVHLRNRKTCTSIDRTHGPTCSVPVLPAAAFQPLLEALEEFLESLSEQVRPAAHSDEMAEAYRRERAVRFALSDFKALSQEGG